MTVLTETNQTIYTGNGVTTVWATGFKFTQNLDVVIRYKTSGGTEILLAEGPDYSLVGAGVDAGGTATLAFAAAVASTLTIQRTVALTQGVSLRAQGPFSPSVLEAAFDKATYADQQLDRKVKALESAGAPGSVVAGNGLAFVSTTLNVGAGNGIIVNADDVALRFASAVPSTITKTAAVISPSGTFAAAYADHVHGVSTAAPVSVTDSTNAEGVATSLARSDHNHAHGVRGGGTLHAVATSSVAGFMAAADKSKLDRWFEGSVQTTSNATFTIISLGVIPCPCMITLEGIISGYEVGGAGVRYGGGFAYSNGYDAAGFGVAPFLQETILWGHGTTFVGRCNLTGNPLTNLNFNVAGDAAKTINWVATVRLRIAS